MTFSCFIIDDEPMAREIIEAFVSKIDFLQIKGSFPNALDAYQAYLKDPVDVFFLDINMPEMSGMAFLKTLSHPPKIIFTTAYSEYALESYDYNAIDYLLKPIAFERFLKAVNKLISLETSVPVELTTELKPKAHYIDIKEDGLIRQIDTKTILYAQSFGNYVKLFTKVKTYLHTITLKDIEEKLPNTDFLRIHRTTIVNIHFIERFIGGTITIANQKLPVGRSYLNLVKVRLNES